MNGEMSILISLGTLVFFTFTLVKSTDFVVESLVKLSSTARIAKFGVGAFLLALSTSFPELFVGVGSAIDGVPTLSLGNVIGSNIANVSLIMGGAALISGSVAVVGEYLKRDFLFAFIAGSLPLLLLFDRNLNRIDGIILLLVYGYYLFTVFHKKHEKALEHDKERVTGRLFSKFRILRSGSVRKSLAKSMLGMAGVLFSAQMVVRSGQNLAESLGVPVLLVGLFLIAVGTSLPELVLEIRAIAKREVALVFGNLLGSTVANSTLIIGLTALIRPVEVVAVNSYLLATVAYVILFWMFWLLTSTRKRLDRWEGLVLVIGYMIFMFLEFAKANGGLVKVVEAFLGV